MISRNDFLIHDKNSPKRESIITIVSPNEPDNIGTLNEYKQSFSVKNKSQEKSGLFFYKRKTTNSANISEISTKEGASVEEIYNELLRTLRTDEYVEGEFSKTQLFLEKMFIENPLNTDKAFIKAWLTLFSSKNKNDLYNFISICSSLEYSMLNYNADTLVLACFSHQEPLIKEATIRAIEAWEQPQFIGYLENMSKIEFSWLEKYKNEVLEYLRSI